MDPVRVYFVGTAGAGKSALTQAFKLWMDESGFSSMTVNLDPGVEEPGYAPDVDVRDWVSVTEVMRERGLGPNGAQIACADMAALSFGEIAEVIEEFRADYIFIDTPGQIELFAFRQASGVFLEAFQSGHAMIVFVLDPALAKTPAGLVSLLMLSSSVQYRFSTPLELVLGKADLLTDEEKESITAWTTNPERLMDEFETGEDMRSVAASEFLKAMEALGMHKTPLFVSATEMTGIEDLYNTIQQLFMGGEDLSPD